MFDTVAAALAHQFVGNHFSDHKAFNAIESLIRNPATSKEDQRKLIDHMGVNGMGFDPVTDDEFESELAWLLSNE